MHGSLVGSTSGSELFPKKFFPSVEERWDKEEGLKGVIIWQARGQDDTLGEVQLFSQIQSSVHNCKAPEQLLSFHREKHWKEERISQRPSAVNILSPKQGEVHME